MNVFIILLFITTSSATFYPLNKPHKLYKTLVEPFLDIALRSVVTGSLVDPISQLIGGFGHKGKRHKKNKYHGYPPIPFPIGEPYHHEGPYSHPPLPVIHEKEVIYHYGLPPHHAPVHHESCHCRDETHHFGYHGGHLGHHVGPSVPLIQEHLPLLGSEVPGHFE